MLEKEEYRVKGVGIETRLFCNHKNISGKYKSKLNLQNSTYTLKAKGNK